MPRPFCIPLLAFCAALTLAAAAAAHDPGLSTARLRIGSDAIEAEVELREADLGGAPLDSGALGIEVDGRRARVLSVEVAPAPDGHVAARLRYARPPGEELRVTSHLLARMPFGHKQYVRTEGAGAASERILDARAPAFELGLAASAPAPSLAGFFELGVEHIAVGYDHLLFLFALLVACRGWRSVVRVVTTFTLAHSITLAAATLGWVSLPASLVEPLIAASIVVVALLNLTGSDRIRERLFLTFGFGLVHGLGFAGVLRTLGVGGSGAGVALPLAAFNLGVEAGQLGIALAVLPLLSWLRRSPAFLRAGVPACSALACALGVVWLVGRTGLL